MEVVVHVVYGEHADGLGQPGIEGHEPVHAEFIVGDVHVRNLRIGMHACIGAARTMQAHFVTRYARYDALKFALHRVQYLRPARWRRRCLHLPAVQGGADIGNGELEARHA